MKPPKHICDDCENPAKHLIARVMGCYDKPHTEGGNFMVGARVKCICYYGPFDNKRRLKWRGKK